MSKCKITKVDGYYCYEAPGHFDCRLTRLHDPQDVEGGKVIMGLTHFLPNGGTDYGANGFESIYYILEGQMEFTDDEGTKTLLTQGDSVHIPAGANKAVLNTGCTTTKMLVVLRPTA